MNGSQDNVPRRGHLGTGLRLAAVVALAAALGGCALAATVISDKPLVPPREGQVAVRLGADQFNVPVRSLRERRFKSVVRQQYDFSCGSAALATLLSFHYGRPVNEAEVFNAMWKRGDRQRIQKLGFSLFDMKVYLQDLGLRSDGFRVDLAKLVKVGIPAIALIDTGGYKHFVVIKGVRQDEILIGDPALGVKIVTQEAFHKIWNGVVFAIHNDMQLARANFNREEEWRLKPPSPIRMGIDRESIGSQQLLLPRANEY